MEFDGFDIEATNRLDHRQSGAHPSLGIVLMRLRIAEINQHPIAPQPSPITENGLLLRDANELAPRMGVDGDPGEARGDRKSVV